jgi:predicted RNA-binding protein associated with RNAse of E/G family
MMGSVITVHKLNEQGVEVFRYSGILVEEQGTSLKLEARFDRSDVQFFELTFREGDRFIETYYTDRWFNIFEIHDADDDHLKGWYCNITRPARIEQGHIYAEDLALDLLVYPDGRRRVLDEDEFEEMELSESDRKNALSALEELKQWVKARKGPFSRLAAENRPTM